jgi:predicted AlkP superfamily pyrophosphatase or phosphodiesterase
MRLKLLAAAAVFLATPAASQAPQPPKLLVVISVDQFSANLFDEYRPQYTAGMARLASGTVFHNGYQSHANTETCPGHSTILTGDHPSRTGIVSNTWYDQSIERLDKTVYCAEDERVPGSHSTNYTVSPLHLMVPTLGELMKGPWPESRNVAVSGKDRAAVMMTGHKVDQRWYWDGQRFTTDLSSVPVPKTLAKANAAIAAALAQPRPPLEPPPFCQSKARSITVEGGGKPVGTGQFARAANDANALRASPELDGDTLAIAAGLVDEMQLGRRAAPDVLAISLSATDYIGHTYGTEGEEMCLNMFELDREVGDFLKLLDSRGLNYEVVLTADHGGKDIPERERLAGAADAARVDPNLLAGRVGAAVANQLHLATFGISGSSFGDMYVDRSLPPADRKRVLDAAVAKYRSHPQVEAVFTADELARTPVSTAPPEKWSLIERVRANYYPGRSGDFYVVLKKDITPIADTSQGFAATHGSPWDYDRRVPILFWRPGVNGSAIEHSAETTDILPTLAAIIGLPIEPGSIDGHCLPDVPGASCPAR